jgi:hypothetical protein
MWMRWTGNTDAQAVFVEKLKGKMPVGRPKCGWEDNTEMDHRKIGCGSMSWIHLARDRVQWCIFVKTVMNFRFP